MGKIKKLLGGIIGIFILFAIIGAFLPSEDVSSTETKTAAKKTTPTTKTTTTETAEGSSGWRDSTPTDASGWHIKGALYEMEDDDDTNALQCYENALKLDPEN